MICPNCFEDLKVAHSCAKPDANPANLGRIYEEMQRLHLQLREALEHNQSIRDQIARATKEKEDTVRLNQELQNRHQKTMLGLWQLLRAYAGGGMPPLITKGIRLACQNVGMSEDHIASAELGGDDPDFIKQETEKRNVSQQNIHPPGCQCEDEQHKRKCPVCEGKSPEICSACMGSGLDG